MDAWYFKSSDSEVGPISHNELVELVKQKRLFPEDLVRLGESGRWRRASTVALLMGHFSPEGAKDDAVNTESAQNVIASNPVKPASKVVESNRTEAQSKKESRAVTQSAAAASRPSAESRASAGTSKSAAVAEAKVAPAEAKSDAEIVANMESRWLDLLRGRGWWCFVRGIEYGPLDFASLIHWTSIGFLGRQDYVSLRMESQALAEEFPDLFAQSDQQGQGGQTEAGVPPGAPMDFFGNQGPAGYPAPFHPGMPMMSPVAPGMESVWWCQIQGIEYGPVALPQLIDWASQGILGRQDYVRFGMEPYVLAESFPDLFAYRPDQQQQSTAPEAEDKTAVISDLHDLYFKSKSKKETESSESSNVMVVQQIPLQKLASEEPPTFVFFSKPRLATGGSLPSAGRMGARRAVPVQPLNGASDPLEKIRALVTSPLGLQVGGASIALVAILLILFILPASHGANIARIKKIEAVLADVEKLRSGSTVKADEAKAVSTKLGEAAKAVSGELKSANDKVSKTVLVLANKVEELSQQDLSQSDPDAKKPSPEEKKARSAITAAKSALVNAKRSVGIQSK